MPLTLSDRKRTNSGMSRQLRALMVTLANNLGCEDASMLAMTLSKVGPLL